MAEAARSPTDAAGLPEAAAPALVQLADGDTLDLRVGPVAKHLEDDTVRMLAYNGSLPGPTLVVRQGSEVTVNVLNQGDHDTTVHWHGLRLQNRNDGVPHETQAPIAVGGELTYRIEFPDPGLYWYHPHVREDYGQEPGLYGNILVRPTDQDYWPPVDREIVLTLDDLLLVDGKVAPFSRDETTHAAMGRFGNLLLTGGEPAPRLTASTGEVVRLWLTNTAGTRVFKVRLPGARTKLVGGDSGRVEHDELVPEVLLAPSERAVVDVMFDQVGELVLEHHTPRRTYPLATVVVRGGTGATAAARAFEELRRAPEFRAERHRLRETLTTPPDKVLAMVAETELHPSGQDADQAPHHHRSHPDPMDLPEDLHHTVADRIEWEDEMVEANAMTTPATMRWRLVDRTSGGDAAPAGWRFSVGDREKIRLVNELESDHPMHHPFHLHGGGRFLVLGRDGMVEPNLVWKDTVLVRTGETVDILFEVTNPGTWMAHCHIAEHMQSGMMFEFTVTL